MQGEAERGCVAANNARNCGFGQTLTLRGLERDGLVQ